MEDFTTKHQTLNRSFARRIGKSLKATDQKILQEVLPDFLYSEQAVDEPKGYQKTYLEIGFGMGEHLLQQISCNQNSLYIGAEVYLNGVASFLKQASAKQLTNYMIWPNDVDELFENITPSILDGIYILFPDPWPKRRQIKKRLVNEQRLNIMKSKLKKGAFIIFASDIIDYFSAVLDLFAADKDFIITQANGHVTHENYVQTKYHKKAMQEGRDINFLIVQLHPI